MNGLLQSRCGCFDQLSVQHILQFKFLIDLLVNSHMVRDFHFVENRRKINFFPLPMIEMSGRLEYLTLTYHLINGSESKGSHDFTKILYKKLEIIDHMIRITREEFSQIGVLRGDADWTGIEVTLTHHDATFHDQRTCSDSPFFCSQKGGNGQVATCPELSVSLKDHTASKVIFDQGLMGFGESKLPRKSCMSD